MFGYVTNYTADTQAVPFSTFQICPDEITELLTSQENLIVAPIVFLDKARLSTFQACAHKVLS